MQAVVLTGHKHMELQELPVPQADTGSLLLRVQASAICNTTDWRVYTAQDPTTVWPNQNFPIILGHEICGEVIDTGPEVTGWDIGDRLAGWCCGYGGFAEYCRVYPAYLTAMKVPRAMPAVHAALLEPAIGTVRYLRAKDGWAVKRADNVAVTGLGPAGLLYVQYAQLLGAGAVYAVDHNEHRREMARRLGATSVFENISDMASYGPFDVVMETTGAAIQADLAKMIRSGTTIVPFGVGQNWKETVTLDGISVQVLAKAGHEQARAALPQLQQWLNDGQLDLESLISARISLHEIPEYLNRLQQRPKNMIKVVALPDDRES